MLAKSLRRHAVKADMKNSSYCVHSSAYSLLAEFWCSELCLVLQGTLGAGWRLTGQGEFSLTLEICISMYYPRAGCSCIEEFHNSPKCRITKVYLPGDKLTVRVAVHSPPCALGTGPESSRKGAAHTFHLHL